MSSKTFLLRTVMALIAVFSLAINIWIGFELLQWLGLVFYLICFVMYAKSLYLALAKTKKVTADLLVVTVMIVSLLAGQPLSGALVAWFISMGLTISWAIIEKTRRKIEALTKERQKLVRVFRDETILELPVEEVREGDTVIVPQGEMIAVDGEIIEGSSSIDEAVITGEPFPVYKGVGDSVTSGAISLTSQLNIRATSDGDKGYLHVMAERIGKQLKIKPKIHQTASSLSPVANTIFFMPSSCSSLPSPVT
jgi:Cu+-exporting ATPase